MNIQKAIEILKQDWASQETGEQSDYQDAVRLGIEALKDKVSYRKRYPISPISLLPGETTD